MRRNAFFIVLWVALVAQAHATQKKVVDKSQESFGDLKEHQIKNRKDHASKILAFLECMKSDVDSKVFNLCSRTEMQEIRSRIENFCQFSVQGIQKTHDYVVFYGSRLSKQSAHPEEQ